MSPRRKRQSSSPMSRNKFLSSALGRRVINSLCCGNELIIYCRMPVSDEVWNRDEKAMEITCIIQVAFPEIYITNATGSSSKEFQAKTTSSPSLLLLTLPRNSASST